MPNNTDTDRISNKQKMKNTARTVKYFYAIVWKKHPVYFLVVTLSVIFTALSPFINILVPKMIIDELLGGRAVDKLIFYVAVIGIGNSFLALVNKVLTETINNYGDLFERHFEIQLSEKAMNIDFENTEDPKVLDLCTKATRGMSWYSGGVKGLTQCIVGIISSVITLFGVGYIVLLKAPLLIILIIINVIFSTIFNTKINQIEIKFFDSLSSINRAFGYIYWELPSFHYGKDIRIYQAQDMVLEKGESYNNNITKKWQGQANEQTKYVEGQVLVSSVLQIGTYIYIGIQAIRKLITIGDFTMLASSTLTFTNYLVGIIWYIQEIHKKSKYMNEYINFMECENAMIMGEKTVPKSEQYTIEFKNVTFAYPRTEEAVLKNVNITLNSGDHLSVVGLNGAGKTTFVKLLCRMYDVTSGEILLNGVNIKEYEYKEYMKLFAAVFQDFKLFAFSLKDNVVLDDENVDEEQLKEFLNLAGLEERIKTLENGMDTSLYKQFDPKGVEPSGGEAQKIAIARALYKDAPVVILDEPTAALDPVAEYEIYNHFDKLVGNKMAIYISHRLSSCKFCDNIAVFAEGTIKEFGTHDELVKIQDGIYAEMYKTQAQYYNV